MKDYSELREIPFEKESIYEGKILHVEKWQVTCPNGHAAPREIVVHNGAAARSKDADAAVARETERMNNAKKTAKNFIEVLEQDIRGHLELLEKLKNEDLTEEPIPAPAHKIYDFDREEAAEQRRTEPDVVETAADIADAIEQNIGKIMEMEAPQTTEAPAEEEPKASMENTIKFTNLQFGRNYDPTTDA